MDATEKLLAAIEQVRDESRQRGADMAKRLDRIDGRLDNLDRTDGLLAGEVRGLTNRVGGIEERVRRLEDDHNMAKRQSIEGDHAQAEALTAAMVIHGEALSALRTETSGRLDAQDVKLAGIADDAKTTKEVVVELANDARKVLRHPVLRRVLLVAAIVGATIGGAAAGYVGARAEHSVTKTP